MRYCSDIYSSANIAASTLHNVDAIDVLWHVTIAEAHAKYSQCWNQAMDNEKKFNQTLDFAVSSVLLARSAGWQMPNSQDVSISFRLRWGCLENKLWKTRREGMTAKKNKIDWEGGEDYDASKCNRHVSAAIDNLIQICWSGMYFGALECHERHKLKIEWQIEILSLAQILIRMRVNQPKFH